eukprot:TRINITY_DN17266_c0_g1_i1.p1 TRINITY_DN17266_c0_g1~~TRINITY_DN17266_c0_g1_i1.p1  ORF type:complete len:775 (+),score=231.93 TRINITY_DN17266_c0_g1_i1:106-2430(+)
MAAEQQAPSPGGAERLVTAIRGVRYDVTEFAETHPGGRHMFDLAVGRDATIMFESAHVRLQRAEAVLATLPHAAPGAGSALGFDDPAPGSSDEKFPTPSRSELYEAIRKRVAVEVLQGRNGRGVNWLHFTAVLGTFLSTAILFVLYPSLLTGSALGLALAWIGTGVQHSANHGSLTQSPTVNYLLGWLDDLGPGGSSLCWRYHHQVSHHAYTNCLKRDQDVFAQFPVLRLDNDQPLHWYHRYQCLYLPIGLPLLWFTVQSADIMQLLDHSAHLVRFRGTSRKETVIALTLKLAHLLWLFVLPTYLHGWRTMLLPWAATLGLGSLFLGLTFIVSHNIEDTKGDSLSKEAAADWAQWQIETSASWGGRVASFFTGGLNLQIEHHLFPCCRHDLYPDIQPIVKEECAKRGIRYSTHTTLPEIIWLMITFLYRMGRPREGFTMDMPIPECAAVAAHTLREKGQQVAEDAGNMARGVSKVSKTEGRWLDLWRPLYLGCMYQAAQEWYCSSWARDNALWVDVLWQKPAAITVLYLAMIWGGRRYMRDREADPDLRKYMWTYNMYQIAVNAWCVWVFLREVVKAEHHPFHVGVHETSYNIGFMIWVHYNNKFIELLDTFFIVFNKKDHQLTFLHVYHHLLLLWSWWAVCKFGGCGGIAWASACINSAVHVLMYGYYFLASLGVPCPWKEQLTRVQMGQFVGALCTAVYAYTRDIYPKSLALLNAAVMVNMLALFIPFYRSRYQRAKQAALAAPAASDLPATAAGGGSAELRRRAPAPSPES